MPSKYLNDARTGELIQKIYTADRAIATECKGYTDTEVTSSATSLTATITALIDTKCAQAKLDAHPVGSFYESTDSTSPATLFGGTWQEQIPDGELIGSIAAFAGNSLPSGWLLCNGDTVSRETYAALFTAIGTTYGAGDGSTTFNLPNLTNKFIQGNATSGTVKAAGLPNITGAFRGAKYNTGDYSPISVATGFGSAFEVDGYQGSTVTRVSNGSSGDSARVISFDASRSSSVYGNSTTVQPPAVTMKFAIYAGYTSLHRWLRTA